jgi:uncharacterized damage-inducible protein DinB
MEDRRVLLELLRGQGAHTDSVACVSGLTAAQASQAVGLSPHSIWEIVLHLNYWMDYEVQRIRGTPAPYPASALLSWPKVPQAAAPSAWDEAVARFTGLLEAFAEIAQTPGLPEKEVPPVHATEKDIDRTVQGVLWQTVAHNSYHLGQVALLRRAISAWPPPGGSDTW